MAASEILAVTCTVFLPGRVPPVGLILALCWTPAVMAEPLLDKTDLFEAAKGGYLLYRIPGVVVTTKGTILAYCEGRQNDSSDWGPTDILMRRSTDGGKTWGIPGRSSPLTARSLRTPPPWQKSLPVKGRSRSTARWPSWTAKPEPFTSCAVWRMPAASTCAATTTA